MQRANNRHGAAAFCGAEHRAFGKGNLRDTFGQNGLVALRQIRDQVCRSAGLYGVRGQSDARNKTSQKGTQNTTH